MTIEPLTELTIPAFRALLDEYGQLRSFDQALGDYHKELADLPGPYAPPDGYALIAMDDEHGAGCVAFRRIDADCCEMKRLFVPERYQGKGLGRALCEELIECAKHAGYSHMRLDTHPWMTTAQNLYDMLGFVEIERYNDNPTPGIRFFELTLQL